MYFFFGIYWFEKCLVVVVEVGVYLDWGDCDIVVWLLVVSELNGWEGCVFVVGYGVVLVSEF